MCPQFPQAPKRIPISTEMQADLEPDPRAASGKACSQTPLRENLVDGCFCLLARPFHNCFLVCCSPVGLKHKLCWLLG